jgi:hypothetical protein
MKCHIMKAQYIYTVFEAVFDVEYLTKHKAAAYILLYCFKQPDVCCVIYICSYVFYET